MNENRVTRLIDFLSKHQNVANRNKIDYAPNKSLNGLHSMEKRNAKK